MTSAESLHAPPPKVKKTVTLDAELVAAVGDGNLSFEVNEALAERVAGQRRSQSLRAYLDDYAAAECGFDEEQVQEFMTMLDGQAGA